MEQTISQLLETYSAKYPERLREVAEAYCGATTRLGGVNGVALQPSCDDVWTVAQEHGLDINLLRMAVGDYSTIETRSISMHLQHGRKPA